MDTKMMTINISMPKALYKSAQRQAKKYHYVSVSEVIRDALRWWLNDNLTRNGFTPEFEAEVLRGEKEPIDNEIVWDGKTPFSEFIEKNLPGKYDKNRVLKRVSVKPQRTINRRASVERGDRHQGVVV